jgi:hypothetical protein
MQHAGKSSTTDDNRLPILPIADAILPLPLEIISRIQQWH